MAFSIRKHKKTQINDLPRSVLKFIFNKCVSPPVCLFIFVKHFTHVLLHILERNDVFLRSHYWLFSIFWLDLKFLSVSSIFYKVVFNFFVSNIFYCNILLGFSVASAVVDVSQLHAAERDQFVICGEKC